MPTPETSFYQATTSNSENDKRLFAPSSARNKDVILEILLQHAPKKGHALEIACGTGEHATHFSSHLPNLIWQPTDIEEDHLKSVNAHAKANGLQNVQPAHLLDVTQSDWREESWANSELDLIYNANMIHISPWFCTLGLMEGAGRHLKSGGILFMYGPYKRNGDHTAPSNAQFDQNLKLRSADWGIRDLEEVVSIAKQNALSLKEIIEMPANNLCVVYQKD